MKKAYVFIALATLAFASCDKITELADINTNIDYKETVNLPALPGNIDTLPPGGLTAYFPGQGFATNSDQYVSEKGTSPNLVKHVKLTKLSTSVKDPASGNFDFVDTLQVFLFAKGMEEKLVAYKYNVPKGQSKIDLDCVADLNLKDYFLKDSMFLRFGGHFVSVPDSTSKIELATTFNMLANPLQK